MNINLVTSGLGTALALGIFLSFMIVLLIVTCQLTAYVIRSKVQSFLTPRSPRLARAASRTSTRRRAPVQRSRPTAPNFWTSQPVGSFWQSNGDRNG